ncbi:MAG: GTP-binding protein, partial [Oscillospiraceae bacterium]
GFLGSGKTTAITAIGKMLISHGKRVGVITNDQGANLVDTNYIKNEGMRVFEITDGCFCCSFDAFTQKLKDLTEDEMPDIILAEPIGSCINLVATIFKPIMNNYTNNFNLAPLSVVADPKRVKRMMTDSGSFKNEINYMFDQQLSEADVILLNKTDTLSDADISELTNYLSVKYSPAQVLPISAAKNIGIDIWYDLVSNAVAVDKPSPDIDYAIYSLAESSLAWNSYFATLESNETTDFNVVIEDAINNIRHNLGKNEIAHLKVYAVSSYDFAKAGLTSTDGEINFNQRLTQNASKINLIVNARVECTPENLKTAVKNGLNDVFSKYNLTASAEKSECYSPNYTMPTCRF